MRCRRLLMSLPSASAMLLVLVLFAAGSACDDDSADDSVEADEAEQALDDGESDDGDADCTIFGEVPNFGDDWQIYLAEANDRGEPGEAIEDAEIDDGQWCVVADEPDFGPDLLVVAESGEDRLRQPILNSGGIQISTHSEALLRLLVDEGIRITDLEAEAYDEVDELARQAAADLDDSDFNRLPAHLDRLQATMRLDEALMDRVGVIFAAQR